MRLIAILSPTNKWRTKTEYVKLRKFLQKDGYIRIAPEVFMRIVTNRKVSEKHYRRIEQFAPKTGTVRLLRLTEKQYQNIYMVSGEADYQEKTVVSNVILCYNFQYKKLVTTYWIYNGLLILDVMVERPSKNGVSFNNLK